MFKMVLDSFSCEPTPGHGLEELFMEALRRSPAGIGSLPLEGLLTFLEQRLQTTFVQINIRACPWNRFQSLRSIRVPGYGSAPRAFGFQPKGSTMLATRTRILATVYKIVVVSGNVIRADANFLPASAQIITMSERVVSTANPLLRSGEPCAGTLPSPIACICASMNLA